MPQGDRLEECRMWVHMPQGDRCTTQWLGVLYMSPRTPTVVQGNQPHSIHVDPHVTTLDNYIFPKTLNPGACGPTSDNVAIIFKPYRPN